MAIEDMLLKFIGLPAFIGLVTAFICAKWISKRPYVIILFAVLGALLGLGLGKGQ